MLSAMRSASVVSVLVLVSASADPAYTSLRGSRSLSDAVENVTAMTTSAGEVDAAEAGAREDALLEAVWEEPDSGLAAAGVNGSNSAAVDWADLMAMAEELSEGNASEGDVEALLLMSGGWHQGGDKMWGSGAGVESIRFGNVGYFNAGMYAARSRCGGAGCALIVNPPGHRTVNQFHIHFVHYRSYGADLKRRLEREVCGKSGWRGGGLPCGGRAAYFPGFPRVFSKAMGAGGLQHASVIAWPASCGGRGTIVEMAYGCSIEHQIRGDYNPRYR
jgi:hypothetical protein